jgi:hypothetical protein
MPSGHIYHNYVCSPITLTIVLESILTDWATIKVFFLAQFDLVVDVVKVD